MGSSSSHNKRYLRSQKEEDYYNIILFILQILIILIDYTFSFFGHDMNLFFWKCLQGHVKYQKHKKIFFFQ